jgi:AhpD family alkylhydroperoxidase
MEYKMNLNPISIENANEKQKRLLEQTKETYRTIPKMQMLMANVPSLLQSYLDGMASFRKEVLFNPVEQEIIFMMISYQNECYSCLASHGMIAEKISKVPIEIINEIKEKKALSDKKLNALAVFTSVIVSTKGIPSTEDISNFIQAGYQEEHILGIIHALSLKIMSNYTNHIFQSELNDLSKKWLLK